MDRLAHVLAPSTREVLARRGVELSQIGVLWRGDQLSHLFLRGGIHEEARRALLADPASAGLVHLGFDDETFPPLDLLDRPSLKSMRIFESSALDVSRMLAAAPQLHVLQIHARRAELGSHAALTDLVLVLSTWPFRRGFELPALRRLRLAIAGPIDPHALGALGDCAPALERLEIIDPIDDMLRCLRDAPPLPVARVVVNGTASIALGRELVERPGNLAELPSMIVDCRGKGRRWLDCFAGDRETRAQKLATKGAQWSELFAACTEPPSPSIVVDDAIAFLPFSPRERALRDCGRDAAQVLVYADWLEEQGAEAMAAELRRVKLAEPVFAIQRADDNYRDSFRQTAFVLLDAWRQLSPRAPIREATAAFRERIHARLQNLSFRKLSKRDAAALAAVDQAIPDERRPAIGPLLRTVQILRGVVAVESTGGYLVVVTNGYALVPT